MEKFLFLSVIALCGTCTSSVNVESGNRIAGASPATNDREFGYMISLQEKSLLNNATRGHRCGGALVDLRHAVTAASCLFDNINGIYTVLDPENYRVFAGALDLTNDTSADRHRNVERFTIHPDYRPESPYANDIAVITFESEFLPGIVRIATLASTDATHPLPFCTSSGWGSKNHTNIPSTQLMQIGKIEMANNENCQVYYTNPIGPQVTIRNTMICATALTPYSSCGGDLGNPLICNGNFKGILIHPGNSNCSSLTAIPRPEIYTRVFTFRSWIYSVSGASTFQPGMAVLAVIAIVQIITQNVLH